MRANPIGRKPACRKYDRIDGRRRCRQASCCPIVVVTLMADSSDTLALGLQHHRNGELVQAEQIYRQVLQTDATNADALLYLGAVHMARGRFDEAAASFEQV